MRMVNISNEKSMQSYTARCSRYKNKYTNLVCGKTAVGRNYNLPRDTHTLTPRLFEKKQKPLKIKQWMLKSAKNLKGIDSLLWIEVFEVIPKIGGK